MKSSQKTALFFSALNPAKPIQTQSSGQIKIRKKAFS
jgi:hypothetical protein